MTEPQNDRRDRPLKVFPVGRDSQQVHAWTGRRWAPRGPQHHTYDQAWAYLLELNRAGQGRYLARNEPIPEGMFS